MGEILEGPVAGGLCEIRLVLMVLSVLSSSWVLELF